jgi:hypothetical protein
MSDKHRFKDNPNYAGKTPQPLLPACHDGSHMLDVECSACGNIDHLHESVLTRMPRDAIIGARCQSCGHVNVLEASYVRAGFAEMRRRGWIA